MASSLLTIYPGFEYNIDRLYCFEDIYKSFKQRLVGYVDTVTEDLVPVYVRFPEDEVEEELTFPAFIIDHISYKIDTNRTESRERQEWYNFITNRATIREKAFPIVIQAQIGAYDRYRKTSLNQMYWMMQQFERAIELDVLGNKLNVFFGEEPINMDATLTDAQRQFQSILPCVIHARVFPAVVESAPLIYQRVYRFSVI